MKNIAVQAAEGLALAAAGPEGTDFRGRSQNWFNLYRLAVASFFLASAFLYRGTNALGSQEPALFFGASTVYWILAVAFAGLQDRAHRHGDGYLTVTVLADIVFLTLLMYANGGYRSGITFLVLVVLAGAALVGQGRLTFFYAAVATIALLLEQSFRVLSQAGDAADFTLVGFTSTGFFAITLLMRMLARRVMENESLARQRGIDLAKQERVNELVIQDMQDGVLVVDGSGRVRQCNPQARRVLGTPEQPGAELARFSPELAVCMAGVGEGLPGSSYSFRHGANGRSLMARFAAAGPGGDVIIYLEDQDRLKNRAEQVKLAALGRLTAGIAHEIRNPLSAIGHAADLLREESDGRTQARLTRIINDNVRRMEAMVRDVLELGRRDRAAPEAIWLASFLAAFVEELCARESVAPGTVRLAVPPDVVLQFDRAHLNQVLWNLLRNALRHSSRGPGAVRLFVAENPAQPEAAELHIVDDGPGIGPALGEQIFEPFFTTESRGTGLGLYIARELCEANGATLALAENAPGAHFVITGKGTEA